jgi:hypothetical protein
LDQAVWSLINYRTGVDSEVSEFPVFENPLNSKTRARFNAKIEGLSSPAINYIESLQPYNRTVGLPLAASPLWCLHKLNRIDKHRRIAVQTQISLATREHFGFVVPGTDFAGVAEQQTDYGFDLVCKGTYKNLQPKILTFVIFGEPKSGIMLDIDDLMQLYKFVTDEVLVALASRA